jgi:hypothetical protein
LPACIGDKIKDKAQIEKEKSKQRQEDNEHPQVLR